MGKVITDFVVKDCKYFDLEVGDWITWETRFCAYKIVGKIDGAFIYSTEAKLFLRGTDKGLMLYGTSLYSANHSFYSYNDNIGIIIFNDSLSSIEDWI